MRSAVDSSILIDIFSASRTQLEPSRRALEEAQSLGSLVACDIVWAEVRANFASEADFLTAMSAVSVAFDSCDARCAAAAGEAWREYRRQGGRRSQILPDFLVAAHAAGRADRLITRDRGFSRRYFKTLKVHDPSR